MRCDARAPQLSRGVRRILPAMELGGDGMHVPSAGFFVLVGLALVVAAIFLAIQCFSWRSSRTVVGASQAFALTTIMLVLSDALAYGVVRLAQAGWVPGFIEGFPIACAFVWFTIALWPILILAVVEFILVIEIPVLRRSRTPVRMLHIAALGACGSWLATLDYIGRTSAKS